MKPKSDPTDITMSENYVSRWLRAMRTDSRLTLAEKGFAGVLSTFATHETGRDCYPSNQRLTLLTGVSDRSIARYRNKLLSTGWLVMVREGGGLATTEVALTYPDPSLYDMTLWTRKLEGEAPQSTPDTSVTPDTPVTPPLTPVSPNLLMDLLKNLLRERERVLRADPSRTSRPAMPTRSPLHQSRSDLSSRRAW